jgi:hypothetical protein
MLRTTQPLHGTQQVEALSEAEDAAFTVPIAFLPGDLNSQTRLLLQACSKKQSMGGSGRVACLLCKGQRANHKPEGLAR